MRDGEGVWPYLLLKPAYAGFLFWESMLNKTSELVICEDYRWSMLMCVAILLVALGFWKNQAGMTRFNLDSLMKQESWLDMNLCWEPGGKLGMGIYSHVEKDVRLFARKEVEVMKPECQLDPRLAVFTFKSMDLNLIDLETLMILRGVGQKSAMSIISYRQNRGPFCKIEDLLRVKGLGPARLKVLRQSLVVNISDNY